jgi:uncharacterized membrane protein
MSISVSASVDIARPAAEVFDYVANFENNPAWQKGMESARYTSPAPHGLGATYDQVASFLGREIITSFEVTALDPGRSITITSTSGTFPIEVTRTVEATGDGSCRASAAVNGSPGGLFKLAAPLMRAMVGSSVRKDWAALKVMLEAQS